MDWMKNILLFPEGDGGGSGEGEGEGGEAAAKEGEGGTGAVSTKDAPAPPKFDRASAVPAGVLPAELNMYEGKTWDDVFKGTGEMRRTLTKAQEDNKSLTDKLAKAVASPEGAEAARREAMVTTNEYQQILANFYETGEVPQQFIDAVAQQGVTVVPDELLEFFEWKKGRREQVLTAGAEAAPEGVDFNDLLSWLNSGNSPFDADERKTFLKMADRGNYGWVEMVATDYQKAVEANNHRPKLAGNRFMGGEGRPGKPALGGDKVGFKDTADFASALRAVDNDKNLDPGQKQARKNEIIKQRARQRGETIPRLM